MKSQVHGYSRKIVTHAIHWQSSNFESEVEMCVRKRVKSRLGWQFIDGERHSFFIIAVYRCNPSSHRVVGHALN
jgi:CRISPR/Cas system-associated endoribonuclease Cas2